MTPLDAGTTLKQVGHTLCASNPAMLELRIMNALRRRLPELMARHQIPGVQCAVAIDQRAVRELAFGEADVRGDVRMTTSTRFAIGSLSKPVAAAVMLDLAARGQIDLDAPIGKLVGQFAESLHEGLSGLTCRQLLRHDGEIPHVDSVWRGVDEDLVLEFESTNARQFRDRVIDAKRHSRYYSSRGYSILQLVVERYLGRTFDAIARRTFEQAGSGIRCDAASARDEGLARDHAGGGEGLPRRWTAATAASGMVGTARDIAVVMQWALGQRSMTDLFEQQSDAIAPYTCGLHVWKDVDGRILDHGAARIGMRGVLKVIPKAGMVFVMLANGENGVEISRTLVGLVEELGLARIQFWS